MKKTLVVVLTLICVTFSGVPVRAEKVFARDILQTSAGPVEVTFIGHATLMLKYNGKVIHVDPYSKVAEYGGMPKADIVLLTHHHRDHLDIDALSKIRTEATQIILTELCAAQVSGGIVLHNGDEKVIDEITIKAVPAYNLVHKRENGEFFHPRGEGNGYVLTIGKTNIYIAGDTENTPEMKELKSIDYAFLPMNLPYTMTPEMVADAAKIFKPKVLYPYHYGETDTEEIVKLMADTPAVEVRIRDMR